MTHPFRTASLAAFSVIVLTACGVEDSELSDATDAVADDADARFAAGPGLDRAPIGSIGGIEPIEPGDDQGQEEEEVIEDGTDPAVVEACEAAINRYEEALGASTEALMETSIMAEAGFELNLELDARVEAVVDGMLSMETQARATGELSQQELEVLIPMIQNTWNSADYAARHADVMSEMDIHSAVPVGDLLDTNMRQLDEMIVQVGTCMQK